MIRSNPSFGLFSWLDLLKQWWQTDRVRISPKEGRMLRIEVPCILEIDGERWLVESRELLRDERGPLIRYLCRDEKDTESEIRAYPSTDAGSQNELIWNRDGEVRRLDENEIGIYPLNAGRGQYC